VRLVRAYCNTPPPLKQMALLRREIENGIKLLRFFEYLLSRLAKNSKNCESNLWEFSFQREVFQIREGDTDGSDVKRYSF